MVPRHKIDTSRCIRLVLFIIDRTLEGQMAQTFSLHPVCYVSKILRLIMRIQNDGREK